MSDPALADTLATIAEAAPKLRDAGVRSVRVGAVTFEISPPDPPGPAFAELEDEKGPRDALDDPDTFGGRTPPRRRRSDQDA